jgi:hypothetical protein
MNRTLSIVLPTPDAISEARARYAQERLDYHDHCPDIRPGKEAVQ